MYLTHGSRAGSVEGFAHRDGRRGARGPEDHREVSGIGDSSESLVGSDPGDIAGKQQPQTCRADAAPHDGRRPGRGQEGAGCQRRFPVITARSMDCASEPGVIAAGAGALPGARRRCEAGKRTHGPGTRACLALLAATALLALAAPAQAQTEMVPADWALKPADIAAGGQFRLIFVSSTTRDATSTDIAAYNTFVSTRAAAGVTAMQTYADDFKALVSTESVNARTNTLTRATDTDVPIYWVRTGTVPAGSRVADDYADLYDGTWKTGAGGYDESGGTVSIDSDRFWTGMNTDGTTHATLFMGASGNVYTWRVTSSAVLSASLDHSGTYRIVALSPVFQVAGGTTNTAPTAANNTVTTGEDRAYAFEADDFGFDDDDAGATLASVTIVTLPMVGTLALDGTAVMADDVVTTAQIDGDMLTFTPARDAHGDPYTTFTFTVNDGTDDSASAYTMTIDVTDAPLPVCGVPDIAGDGRRQIWTGTVTVGTYTFLGSTFYGYSSSASAGELDDRTFTIGSNDYTVDRARVEFGGSHSGTLVFELLAGQRLTTVEVEALRLHVCDTVVYNFSGATTLNSSSWSTTLDWSPPVETRTLYLSLPANNVATGEPAITGTAQAAQELTADASPIMDTDGLPSIFTYQWLRVDADGTSNPVDITDATAATYTLTAADAGKKIKVQVSFTDELSGEEERTSAAYPSSGTVTTAASTTAPALTSVTVTSTPHKTTDTYGAREHIEFSMTFDAPVTVTGDPEFAFDLGGASTATWYAGSGTTTLRFSHTVSGGSSGDRDTNGISWAENKIALNGGTIAGTDNAVAAVLTHAAQSNLAGHKVDGRTTAVTAATVTVAVTSTPTSLADTYGFGETIVITVTASEAVEVVGDPEFEFSLTNPGSAANNPQATYDRTRSIATTIVFTYTVQAGDRDNNGIWIGTHSQTFMLDANDRIRTASQQIDIDRSHPEKGTHADHKVNGSLGAPTVPPDPTAPTLVSATATTLTIEWTHPGDGGSPLTRNFIEYRVEGTTDWTNWYRGETPTPVTRTVITNLQAETAYDVRVHSTNAIGNSQWVQSATAFSTLAGTASCPVPTFTGRRKIWTGVLTMGDFADLFPANSFLGYDSNPESGDGGGLDPGTFTLGLYDYEIRRIALLTSGARSLNFVAGQGDGVWWDSTVDALRLHVCNTPYDFSDSGYGYVDEDRIVIESNHLWATDLDWSGVTTRTVHMSLPLNRPATGAPVITGPATVGKVLTVDVTGIEDEDGLHDVEYTYQWVRVDADGTSNEEDITDATADTYTLTDDDLGKKVKIEVSFPDDFGSDEQRTSAPTETVAGAPNTPATGAPTITGTAQVGQTLTAVTTGIMDADGLTSVSYSYQWIRVDADGTSNPADITDETDATYTLGDADLGTTLKVRVTFADDLGHTETLTSAATATVGAAATGPPTVNDVAVTSTPASGTTYYLAGEVIEFTVTFSAPVTVTATPKFAFRLGAATRQAAYASGSGSAALVFARTVQAGEVDRNGISWNAIALALDGGTITQTGATTAASLIHAEQAPLEGHRVDAAPPMQVSASVHGMSLVLVYDEPLDPASMPATGAYTVTATVGATTTNPAVSEVSIYGIWVTLALDAPPAAGATVTLAYAPPASNPVQDEAGNDAPAFSAQSVRLGPPPPPPPVTDLAQVLGVGVVPGNAQLVVTWTAVSTATGYTVQWMSGGQGYNTGDRQATVTPGSTTRYTIPSLTNGTEYTVRVIATRTGADDGPPSDEMTGTPRVPPPPPVTDLAQVMGVGVVPGNAQLVVTWTAVDNATGYTVQWMSGGQGYNTGDRQATVTPGSTTRYTIPSLTNGTEYTVRVIATRTGATDGPPSAEVKGTPFTTPGAPQHLSGVPGDEQVMLTWDAPSSDGGSAILRYEYAIDDSGTWIDAGLDLEETVPGLTNGQQYAFEVRAVNSAGPGAPARTAATPLGMPSVPESLTATGGDGEVVLEWTEPADDGGAPVTGYEYRFAAGTAVPGDTPWQSAGLDLDWTVTGLTNGQQYAFEVRARNRVGEGEARGALATPVARPGALASLTATAGDEEVALVWSAPADDGGSPVTGYGYRYAAGQAVPEDVTWRDAGTELTATVTGLENETRYTFEVRARNRVGPGETSGTTALPLRLRAELFSSAAAEGEALVVGVRPEREARVSAHAYIGVTDSALPGVTATEEGRDDGLGRQRLEFAAGAAEATVTVTVAFDGERRQDRVLSATLDSAELEVDGVRRPYELVTPTLVVPVTEGDAGAVGGRCPGAGQELGSGVHGEHGPHAGRCGAGGLRDGGRRGAGGRGLHTGLGHVDDRGRRAGAHGGGAGASCAARDGRADAHPEAV